MRFTPKEIVEGLDYMVQSGKLVKISSNGKIGWIDSRSERPNGSIILDGHFKRKPSKETE